MHSCLRSVENAILILVRGIARISFLVLLDARRATKLMLYSCIYVRTYNVYDFSFFSAFESASTTLAACFICLFIDFINYYHCNSERVGTRRSLIERVFCNRRQDDVAWLAKFRNLQKKTTNLFSVACLLKLPQYTISF